MSKYAPGSTYQAGDFVSAWTAANVVQQIAKTLPNRVRPVHLLVLVVDDDLTTMGMTQPLNWTVKQTALGGSIPRASNVQIALYHYVNASLVQVTPFGNHLPGAN